MDDEELREIETSLQEFIARDDGERMAQYFDSQFLAENAEICGILAGRLTLNDSRWAGLLVRIFSLPTKTPAQQMEDFVAVMPIVAELTRGRPRLSAFCVHRIVVSVRVLARARPNEYEECVQALQRMMRVAVPQRHVMMPIANGLFDVYFTRGEFKQASRLGAAVGEIDLEGEPLPMRGHFMYNRGRLAAVLGDAPCAFAYLSKVRAMTRQQEPVLVYLVPVLLILCHIPTAELLESFPSIDWLYGDAVRAAEQGDLMGYDAAVKGRQLVLIRLGMFSAMCRGRRAAVWRRIQFVVLALSKPGAPLALFNALVGPDFVPKFAELAVDGYIAGYIRARQRVVVLKQPLDTDAFRPPDLAEYSHERGG